MAHINYLGGLKRELHHIKVATDEDGGYEPAMVLKHDNRPGRSFIIPLACIWKYIDPSGYVDDIEATNKDWAAVNQQAMQAKMYLTAYGPLSIGKEREQRQQAQLVLDACRYGYAFSKGTGVLMSTSMNLFLALMMFDIEPRPEAAAQLLLWIQARLDDLKNMPENPETDKQHVAGEVEFMVDGKKAFTRPLNVSDTEIAIEQMGMN